MSHVGARKGGSREQHVARPPYHIVGSANASIEDPEMSANVDEHILNGRPYVDNDAVSPHPLTGARETAGSSIWRQLWWVTAAFVVFRVIESAPFIIRDIRKDTRTIQTIHKEWKLMVDVAARADLNHQEMYFLGCLGAPVQGVEGSGTTRGSPMCDRTQLCIAKTFWPSSTNCPTQTWYEEMVQVNPSPQKVTMNIGCSKGNDAVEMMIRWDASDISFSKESRRSALVLAGLHKYVSGACGQIDKRVERQSMISIGLSPVVYCVGAMLRTYALLKSAASSLNYTGAHGGHANGDFKLIHSAASNISGKVIQIPDAEAGNENWGIENPPRGELSTEVNLTSVDDLVRRDRLMLLDILLIDTEGHDPLLLHGAKDTLSGQKVRYVECEVHGVGVWNITALKTVVDELDAFGYECYWRGNFGETMRITGCWIDDYDVGKRWSNVACVLRGDIWRHAPFSRSIIDHLHACRQKQSLKMFSHLPH